MNTALQRPSRSSAPDQLPVAAPAPVYRFRLYVSGDTPNSAQALHNLNAICCQHLAERCTLEVIDVFREPGRALEAGIFMTPTLVRLSPGPPLRIVGTLMPRALVLQSLGVAADGP